MSEYLQDLQRDSLIRLSAAMLYYLDLKETNVNMNNDIDSNSIVIKVMLLGMDRWP